jgi:transcriptional regulator with XRE-family HTH domain
MKKGHNLMKEKHHMPPRETPPARDDFWIPWKDREMEDFPANQRATSFIDSIDNFMLATINCGLYKGIPARCVRLKMVRRARGHSQAALGDLAGVTENTIYRLEHEDRQPKPKTRFLVAAALEVPEDWLFKEDVEDKTTWASAKLIKPGQEGIPLITKPAPAITITITPENEPKIYEALTSAAKEERRTPEAQALYWLEESTIGWSEWRGDQKTNHHPV